MSRMRTFGRITFVMAAALVSSMIGCAQSQFFGTPRFLEPAGSEQYQQTRAQRFAPYPDTNIGPKVDGGRPEGFDAPPPEPARGRPNQWNSAPSYGS